MGAYFVFNITSPETEVLRGNRNAYNVVLALKEDWTVETIDKLPEGVQPQISVEELLICEDVIRADERVIKLAKEVGKLRFTCTRLHTVHSG